MVRIDLDGYNFDNEVVGRVVDSLEPEPPATTAAATRDGATFDSIQETFVDDDFSYGDGAPLTKPLTSTSPSVATTSSEGGLPSPVSYTHLTLPTIYSV